MLFFTSAFQGVFEKTLYPMYENQCIKFLSFLQEHGITLLRLWQRNVYRNFSSHIFLKLLSVLFSSLPVPDLKKVIFFCCAIVVSAYEK